MKRVEICKFAKMLLVIGALILPVHTGAAVAETGDVLYQNCADGDCTGAGSSTGWVREVVTEGCVSGECLKLTASYNTGTELYGAGSTSISAAGISGQNEITVVYYQKFNASVRDIDGANVKAIRPFVGDSSHYFMATIAGFNLVKQNDFYISYNKGTLTPTTIFDPLDENDTYVGDTRYTVANGDGTWDVPNGRIAGKFNQGGQDGFGTQWTKVRQWIKLPSSSTAADGESKLWINDELAFHLTHASMSPDSESTFSDFTFYPSSEAKEAFEHWMDGMVIYEGYVPPHTSVVAWDIDAASVQEGDEKATMAIVRSGSVSGSVVVEWSTLPQSAASGEDFETITWQAVTFEEGEIEKTVEIQILQDALEEGDETFTVRLANPVGCELGSRTQAQVTILDDDGGDGSGDNESSDNEGGDNSGNGTEGDGSNNDNSSGCFVQSMLKFTIAKRR